MPKFNENNLNVSCNYTLKCHAARRVQGKDTDTGEPYDYYKCEFRDPFNDDSYYWNIQTIDGSRPPIKDVEYPVLVSIYKDRRGFIKSFLTISSEYIA